jgi:hypothetical protein
MTTPNERPDVPPLPPTEPGQAEVPPPQPAATTPSTVGADLKAAFESGARTFDERAQGLGREAEVAARRWGENPAVKETADVAGRVWGLVLLAFGLWFFADVTLDMDLPNVRWSEVWPVILIVLGGIVVVRGLARRS